MGQTDEALGVLRDLVERAAVTWEADLTEGLALGTMAAACGEIGAPAAEIARTVYDGLSRFTGTVIVVRAPAAACLGPADHYLGLLAACRGDLALAEVHFETALGMAARMESPPFVTAAEVELARTLRRRRPEAEAKRVAALLRHAEESARSMGLHRLARLAAQPD